MDLNKIKWLGHASFFIEAEGKKLYFIDPFELKRSYGKADIIFITHAHYDHCSPGDIKKIIKEDTILVSSQGCIKPEQFDNEFMLVEPNQELIILGLKVKTMPAYNIRPERLNYHPKANKWVGYIIHVNDMVIYHAGDTDFIPEMKSLGYVDVAFLPMGGTYTMDVDEAIEAARAIKAGVTVPIHYKRLLGDAYKQAEERFKKAVEGALIMEEFA